MSISQFIASRTYQAFRKSLMRNIITISIGTTALSVCVMIISASVFEGFQDQISSKVFGFWGHIHITDVSSHRSIEPIPLKHSQNLINALNDPKVNQSLSNEIINIQEFAVLPGILGYKQDYEGVFLKGVRNTFNWDFLRQFLKQGDIPQFPDSNFSRELILSEQTAKKLKIGLNDELIIHFFLDNKHIQRKLKVKGIYRTGLEEYDKKFVLVDIRLLQQLMNWEKDEVTGIEVFVKDVHKAEEINDYLYQEVLPENIYSESIRNKFPNIFEWLSLQDINKRFILGLILLVCIINMSTTLLILVLSRTTMIGLLTALGMSTWQQRKIFIRYGLRILSKGMIIGNTIGIALCLLQYHFRFIKLSEADYYLDHAPISLNPLLIVAVNLIFFFVVALNLLLPSYMVAKIDPIKALKFR